MHLIKHRQHLRSGVLVILIATLVWLTADFCLEFSFPTYLQSLNKSYFEIGILLSIASLCGILVDLPLGAMSDKVSRKKLMISGLIISIISALFIFTFKMNWLLVLVFLAWGLGFQLWKVPRDAHYAALSKDKNRAAFYGLDLDVRYIAQTVGPIIGGLILSYLSFSGIVSIYATLLIISILIIFFWIKETNHRSILKEIPRAAKWRVLISDLKEVKSFGILGVTLLFFSLLFTAWEQIIWTFGPLFYGKDVLNFSPILGGTLLACFFIPGIFFSYYCGKIADNLGKRITLMLGLFVLGLSIVFFSFSNQLWTILIASLFVALGTMLSLPALNGLIIDLSYKQRKGKIAGIWDLFMDTGYVIGPILGGWIASHFGLRIVFSVIGMVFLTSVSILLIIRYEELSKVNSENIGTKSIPK